MANLNTVFNDAGEQEIRKVVLYAKTSKLWADDKGTVAVAHDVVLEHCMKGTLLVFDTDTYYNPTSFKDALGTLTVSYGTDKTATVK